MEKIIEENKQGQSLVLEQKEGNTKKLFIEKANSEAMSAMLPDMDVSFFDWPFCG